MIPRPIAVELSAQELMGIISSATIAALGEQCQSALARSCGASAFGLYLLRRGGPDLLYSRDVPSGFLEDYAAFFGADDPLIRQLSPQSPVTDGQSCLGDADWSRSELRELLRSWGLGHNMCGLVTVDEATLGVIYAAAPQGKGPFAPGAQEQLGFLCRGAAVALRTLLRQRRRGAEELPPQLSRVASLVCEGLSNKEIARAVGLSEHTVKEHVQRLARRLRADNRTALAVALLRQGYLN